MEILQIMILSLVQGVTEFLPVSSSAHLILFPKLLDWQESGLTFDLAVHFGTLIAVMFYFRHEIMRMIRQWLVKPLPNKHHQESFLVWKIAIATIPIVVAGFILKDFIDVLRTPNIIAFTMIFFGLVLWHSDRHQEKVAKNHPLKSEYEISLLQALLIGMAQILAIIPGTSRSGITMTCAMYLGMSRLSSARFSFLLSIPTILIGFLWQMIKVTRQGMDMSYTDLLLCITLSAFFAWITIHFFLKIIQSIRLDAFVIYRVILGVFIFSIFTI